MAATLKIAMPQRASLVAARPASRCSVVSAAAAYQVTFVNTKDGKETTFECKDDDYVLDAADAAGLDIPCSCRGGVCGTCVSKLLSGNVDDSWLTELDDGNVLTAEQMKAGYILPCSAMPRSDLRIEYSYDWGVSILDQWAHTSRA